MVAAYTTFPTYGVRAAPRAIRRVENARGEVLWEPRVDTTRVLTPQEDWLMIDMMKDVVTKGSAAGAVAGAGFRLPAAGKTGTTNDGTDVWFIGYTADLVAGVWMGLDRPQKIKANAQGGILAAPAWTAFMSEIYQRKPTPPDWPRPEGLISRRVDDTDGMLANPFCPLDHVYTEYYLPGTEPQRICDVHTPYTMSGDSTPRLAPPPPVPKTPDRPRR
jgi:penicillin-binding protein 1A